MPRTIWILLSLVCSVAFSLRGDPGYHSLPREQLFRTVTKSISASGPKLMFKVFALFTYSNFEYRIEVWSEDGAKLQTIDIRNGVELEAHEDRFRVVDLNSDGYLDISILGGFDRRGKVDRPWHKEWLYQPESKSFVVQPLR